MKQNKPVLTLLFLSALIAGCAGSKMVKQPENGIKVLQEAKTEERSAKTDTLLSNLFARYPQHFDTILKNNDQWKVQVIYTQIDRDPQNRPSFRHYYYNHDQGLYFYPASTVKLPVAVLALQKLKQLKKNGIDRKTTIITEPLPHFLEGVYNDPNSVDGRPTIENYIKQILLVSDNDAFNRLYEFLGQEYINRTLHQMGYDSTQIIHRLSIPLNEEQQRTTNPIRFTDSIGQPIYTQASQRSNLSYQKRKTFLGKGYYSGGKLIHSPFDFSYKNRLTLNDLHSIVQSILFPQAVPPKQRFNLEADDYAFLQRYMSMYPKESDFPQYGGPYYNDAYVKFLLYGANDPVNKNIRIFNKVGDAYGFLIDAAYVVDFENNIEYLLSAVIHCNADGIYNDNRYEYETVGFPFMKHLGQAIHQYEKERKRMTKPDLSALKALTY
jgi:hypothetical protein